MSNSTHRVEVVPVELLPHPNADTLSVCKVFGGYDCVVKTDTWKGRSKGFYICPDTLVPTDRPEFSFLAKDARINGMARVKAQKIRQVVSFGLLVPAPDDAVIGEDWAERLGCQHYDPVIAQQCGGQHGQMKLGAEIATAPNVYHVKYDVEAGRRYAQELFVPGEMVVCHEKIHGASARVVFSGGQLHAGSRTEWKRQYASFDHLKAEDLVVKAGSLEQAQEMLDKLRSKKPERNMWWRALDASPAIRTFCEDNPEVVVYAECYGAVQDLRYGRKNGEVALAVFDLMHNGRWLDHEQAKELAEKWNLPWVPLVAGPTPFDFDSVCKLAEGPSLVPGANHIREGIVVRPLQERSDPRLGRCILKWVSGTYLERSK